MEFASSQVGLSGTAFAALTTSRGAIPDQEGESGRNVTFLTLMEEIAMAIKTTGDVMKFAKDNKIEIVDLKFCDVPGLWQHFSVSANEFGEDVFEDGIGFDGSSIRGFQTIDESDMLLIPDPESAFLDPFADVPTVSLTCNVRDPVTCQSYTRDPRFVAQKAETFLKSTGVADISYWGPEIEFYILDNVRFDQSYNYGFYYIDSEEGFWNAG